MTESFGYGKICVVKLHIFSNKSDSYIFVCILCAANHLGPLCQVGSAVRKSQMTAYGMCQSFIFKPQWHLIQRRCCKILDNVLLADIAKQSYLLSHIVGDAFFRAADDYIGLYADGEKLLCGVLGGFGFKLLRASDIGDQSNVDIAYILASLFGADLPDGFEKWGGLNIAYGSAYLGDDHICIGFIGSTVNSVLYLVGDVRYDLYRTAEVIAAALLGDDVPVYLSRSHVGVYRQIFVNKSLVVTEVKVGLRSVIGHEYLAVLEGRHGARVYIDIGVKFLYRHLISALLEKSSQ